MFLFLFPPVLFLFIFQIIVLSTAAVAFSFLLLSFFLSFFFFFFLFPDFSSQFFFSWPNRRVMLIKKRGGLDRLLRGTNRRKQTYHAHEESKLHFMVRSELNPSL